MAEATHAHRDAARPGPESQRTGPRPSEERPVRGGVPGTTDAGSRVLNLMALQGAVGNSAVQRMLASTPGPASPVVQRQTTVGEMCELPDQSTEANQSIAPDVGGVCEEPLRVVTYQGQQHAIPESEWPAFVQNLMRIGRAEMARPVQSKAQQARDLFEHFRELNDDQWAVSWVLEVFSWQDLQDDVLPLITQAEASVEAMTAAFDGEDLDAARIATADAEAKAEAALQRMQQYRDEMIGAGEATVTGLQITQTACFTIFAVAGGAVLAAPAAAGGLGMGVVSSGAIMGGSSALLSSASGVAGQALAHGADSVSWTDLQGVALDTLLGAAGGAIGAGVASKLAPAVTNQLYARLVSRGLFTGVPEEVVKQVIRNAFEGGASNMLQGALTDAVGVLRGTATVGDLVRNAVSNLVAGGIAGIIQGRLRTHSGGHRQIMGSGDDIAVAW